MQQISGRITAVFTFYLIHLFTATKKNYKELLRGIFLPLNLSRNKFKQHDKISENTIQNRMPHCYHLVAAPFTQERDKQQSFVLKENFKTKDVRR